MKLYLDKKAQMMDAGTAFFKAKDGFGSVLGQIKAEMEVHGKVWKASETNMEDMPFSTKEYDLFLDFSTIWRNRYISCRLEDAGDTGRLTQDGEAIRKYAASFKEGNTGTKLRGFVHAFLIISLLAAFFSFFPLNIVIRLLCFCAALYIGYRWLTPSLISQKTVKALKKNIENCFDA